MISKYIFISKSLDNPLSMHLYSLVEEILNRLQITLEDETTHLAKIPAKDVILMFSSIITVNLLETGLIENMPIPIRLKAVKECLKEICHLSLETWLLFQTAKTDEDVVN